MSDSTQKVEVFQPRDPGQFYDRENDEATDEMFYDLRDLRGGFVEAEDISFEKFGDCYDLVGTEQVEADDEDEALTVAFDTWQNKPAGAGRPVSSKFREMNEQERATSMSTGDIIRVNGTAYLCESIGWSEVEEVSL